MEEVKFDNSFFYKQLSLYDGHGLLSFSPTFRNSFHLSFTIHKSN